jgi:hypothetical protein
VLALVFLPPTIIFGITDWLYRFNGVWNALIIAKLVLALLLMVLLLFTALWGRKEDIKFNKILILYALCMIFAMGLGYLGGELQYG